MPRTTEFRACAVASQGVGERPNWSRGGPVASVPRSAQSNGALYVTVTEVVTGDVVLAESTENR